MRQMVRHVRESHKFWSSDRQIVQEAKVTLNGKTYTAAIQSDGTWSVNVGPADLPSFLNGHVYTVAASVTDLAEA